MPPSQNDKPPLSKHPLIGWFQVVYQPVETLRCVGASLCIVMRSNNFRLKAENAFKINARPSTLISTSAMQLTTIVPTHIKYNHILDDRYHAVYIIVVLSHQIVGWLLQPPRSSLIYTHHPGRRVSLSRFMTLIWFPLFLAHLFLVRY
jgi:hypothetical protein